MSSDVLSAITRKSFFLTLWIALVTDVTPSDIENETRDLEMKSNWSGRVQLRMKQSSDCAGVVYDFYCQKIECLRVLVRSLIS